MEGEQAPVFEDLVLDRAFGLGLVTGIPLSQLLLEPCEVAIAAAGVGDDVEGVVCVLGDNCIVDDAPALVEEHGER